MVFGFSKISYSLDGKWKMIFLSHKIHGDVTIPIYMIIPVYLIYSAQCIKFGLILKGQVFFTLQLTPYLVILGWSND